MLGPGELARIRAHLSPCPSSAGCGAGCRSWSSNRACHAVSAGTWIRTPRMSSGVVVAWLGTASRIAAGSLLASMTQNRTAPLSGGSGTRCRSVRMSWPA